MLEERPRTAREIIVSLKISPKKGYDLLRYMFRKGYILRSQKPVFIRNSKSGGRGRGTISNTRIVYFYTVPDTPSQKKKQVQGVTFVRYDPNIHDKKISKSKLIADFLESHKTQAFFAREITDALKEKGITNVDVSCTLRRLEQKGKILRRGFRTHDREIPFLKGFLVTWIDQNKNLVLAMEEAENRIRARISDNSSDNVTWRRIMQIYQICKSFSQDKKIVSYDFLLSKLSCSKWQLDYALSRLLEYYPDIKEIKLFNLFRYFYHTSLQEPYLSAAIDDAKHFIRRVRGRSNRMGHNYEAAVSWFIDRFTDARFWEQQHRGNKMDPRRITISLLKPVGRRQRAAELDRVWTVKADLFSQEITYVLECKYGLVRRKHIDDLLEVLKWSREFGIDSPGFSRQIKNGVIILFAANAFANEHISLGDHKLSLAQYAARLNVKLLKTADLNEILHRHGVPTSISIQKIIKAAANETEVKEILDKIWSSPTKADEIIREYYVKNQSIFEFERTLDSKK